MLEKSEAKVIRITLLGGDLEGLRVVDPLGRVQCLICPRSLFPDAVRKKENLFKNTGVYLLTNTHGGSELPTVYVGKARDVGKRVGNNFVKDFWDTLICFTSIDGSLHEAHAGYLESRLISLALEAKRCKLDNKNKSQSSLSETDTYIANNFLSEILLCMSVLGYKFLEKEIPRGKKAEQEMLYCKAGGINATGYESSDGFVVLKGSEAVKEPVDSLYDRYKWLRNDLKDNGVLREENGKLVLTQDYIFNSSSQAVAVLSGNVMSGPSNWKNQKGIELKELQKRKAQ